MNRVAVPALKPLTYQGRSYVRGEMLVVEPAEALAMSRRGDVSLTRGANIQTRELRAEKPVPLRAQKRAPRGTYRRRDMTAEPSGE